MITITFAKGKKQRNELQLPIQYFVAMDNWIEKIGEKSYIAWLKLCTFADRSDVDRIHDKIPNSLNGLCKRLNVSKETFYQKIIPALWDYGFIDFEEYENAKSKLSCLNIIVYEYPQNNPALATQPLEKARDYATQWTTKNRENGKKGGRPTTGSEIEPGGGSEIEPVEDGSEIEPGGGSEIEPNNVSNKSFNDSNKSFEEEDDDEYVTVQREIFGDKPNLSSTEGWFVQHVLDLDIPLNAAKKIASKVNLSSIEKHVFFKVIDTAMEKLEQNRIHNFANWVIGALENEQTLYQMAGSTRS